MQDAAGRTPTLAFRTHDIQDAPTPQPSNLTDCQVNENEAGTLARQISDVQRAAGQLRMAEAVLDQVALHLVEMESYFSPASAADATWRRQGIDASIQRIRELFDVARINGRKLFGGVGAIEARAAEVAASLELPALDVDSLGDARNGMIATLVELPAHGSTIIVAAQAQIAAQKARVCDCAARIGDMIQTLQIALEMHAAAGVTLADDEFAQAVAQTSQADVFLATRTPAPAVTASPTFLRIQRQPR